MKSSTWWPSGAAGDADEGTARRRRLGWARATIEEFSKLTPHDTFAERLTKLKDEAARKQAETKKAVLTKTAQAQINDLQAMIDRYLDDDVYRAYAEALERSKSDADAKTKSFGEGSGEEGRPKPSAPAVVAKNAPPAKDGCCRIIPRRLQRQRPMPKPKDRHRHLRDVPF